MMQGTREPVATYDSLLAASRVLTAPGARHLGCSPVKPPDSPPDGLEARTGIETEPMDGTNGAQTARDHPDHPPARADHPEGWYPTTQFGSVSETHCAPANLRAGRWQPVLAATRLNRKRGFCGPLSAGWHGGVSAVHPAGRGGAQIISTPTILGRVPPAYPFAVALPG
jgi:hypothetical protein